MGAPRTAQHLKPKVISECTVCQKAIKGKVFAADDKQPLGGAHVVNRTLKTGTTTGDDGSFSLQASPSDDIEISYIGFKTLKIKAGKVPAVIYLQTEVNELAPVVVTPKKPNSNATSQPTTPAKKVEVAPSMNDKLAKNKKWIWLALIALGVIGGAYYFSKNNNKKK